MDATGRALAKWTCLITALLAVLVAALALAVGYPRVAWGYVGGAALGAFLLAGLFLVVYVLLAPPGAGAAPGHKHGALAFQIIKYLLALSVLYLLISRWHVDPLGLGAGIVTPVLVATAVTVLRPRPERKSGSA